MKFKLFNKSKRREDLEYFNGNFLVMVASAEGNLIFVGDKISYITSNGESGYLLSNKTGDIFTFPYDKVICVQNLSDKTWKRLTRDKSKNSAVFG